MTEICLSKRTFKDKAIHAWEPTNEEESYSLQQYNGLESAFN